MWRVVPEGLSTHETAVLAGVDGFKAALCSTFLDLKHEASRRAWRAPWLHVRGFARHDTTLVVHTTTEVVQLPEVSAAFADALATRVASLLPGAPALEVTESALHDTPTSYHLRVVRLRAHHRADFEGSRLAGAWLSIPNELGIRAAGGDVEVEGLFLSDPAKHAAWRGPRGYGHMGMSPAELIAYRYTVLAR